MTAKEDLFDTTQLERSSGIYYEQIGTAKFYTTHWKLLTYLNISALEQKLYMFQSIIRQTNQLCHDPELKKYSACTTSLNLLSKLQPSIEEQDSAFKDLVGHTRTRRGLFDAVGKIFKMFIGTLDADDAEFYNSAINDLTLGEKDLSNLLKTQTQIVQSTISNFNNTMTNIHHVEEVFNTHILLMKNLTLTTNQTLYTQTLKQNVQDHVTLIILLFTELNREYSNLIHSILFARQNILHPSILTPQRIITELVKTRRYLPQNTNYPLHLSVLNAHELMNLLSMSVYYMDSKLIFVINVPITENNQFTLYHLIPIPTKTTNNTYIFIKPTFDHVAISFNKMHYSQVTLTSCKILSSNTYICYRDRPMYNSYMHKICETELIFNHVEMPKSCDIRIGIIENELWYQLTEKNKWLFVAPQITHVTLDCRKKGIFDIQIVNTGFLSIAPQCKAYTKSVTLLPTTEYSSTVDHFIPSFDITLDDNKPDEPRIPKLDFIPLHTPISNLDDLKTASFKLDQISDMVDQSFHKSNTSYKLQIHDIIISFISVIFIILIFYCTVRCIYKSKRRCNPINCCTRLMISHNTPSNETALELRESHYETIPTPDNGTPSEVHSNPPNQDPLTPSAPPITSTATRRSARLRERL